MARLSIDFDNDLIKQIGNLRQIDIVAPKMINESLPIVDKEVRNQLNRVLSTIKDKKKRRSYGTLAKSIKINTCGNIKDGWFGSVSPTGVDNRNKAWRGKKNKETGTRSRAVAPIRNAEKAVYLEHGRLGQTATPFITPAVVASEKEVIAKMQEVFDRELIK